MKSRTRWGLTIAISVLTVLVCQGVGRAAELHGLPQRVTVLEQQVRVLQAQQAATQEALGSIQKTLDTLVTTTSGVGGWAVVDSGGTLARGQNVKGVTLNTQGTPYYVVQFTGKVDQCAALVSSGTPDTELLAVALISGDIVHGMPWTDDSVMIWIRGASGGIVQSPFHLAMIC